ncbi:MAG: acetate kinase [Lachnospiraceae bacterium]|nr:acetate kinase [Lachnospiraceae bacterium]
MKVLVINCGSSSLKYQLIDSVSEEVLAKGLCERIGIDGVLTHKPTGKANVEINAPMPNHTEAVSLVLKYLTDAESGVIASLDEIDAVGHRMVHGGEKFACSTILTDEVLAKVESCNDLAPLHNPANLIGVNACKELMPGVPMVGVFDTAFHQTMPKKAFLYGIPYEYYTNHEVRRFGFHGSSHSFVSKRAAEILGKNVEDMKIIVCHLGNGASICAVDGGKSVDTSMGFTPLEGLIMGTRCGDLDPSIIEYIAKKENMTLAEVMSVLNKKSGLQGLSGISSDFRDLDAAREEGHERADYAVSAFCYRVAKYVGAYAAAMNGVDVVCFTAGAGENDKVVRAEIMSYLGFLGMTLDEEKNQLRGENIITTPDSARIAMVIPTNEELAIARETVALL